MGRKKFPIMSHVVDAAERLGAPWSNSAFIIESACGVVGRLFKGTTHIGKQIFERFLIRGRLREFAKLHIPSSNDERVVELYEKLDPQRLSFTKDLGVRPLGSGRYLDFNPIHADLIGQRIGSEILCSKC